MYPSRLARIRLLLVVGVVAGLFFAAGAGAQGNSVLQLDSSANWYAYIQRDLGLDKDVEGDISFVALIKVDPKNSGSTWAPGIYLLWDEEGLARNGQASLVQQGHNGTLRTDGEPPKDADGNSFKRPAAVWVALRIDVTKDKIKYFVRTAEEDWDQFWERDRADVELGVPVGIALGKGRSGTGLPRSGSTPTDVATHYYDDVSVSVNGELYFFEDFSDPSLPGWTIHLDERVDKPGFQVVTEQ